MKVRLLTVVKSLRELSCRGSPCRRPGLALASRQTEIKVGLMLPIRAPSPTRRGDRTAFAACRGGRASAVVTRDRVLQGGRRIGVVKATDNVNRLDAR